MSNDDLRRLASDPEVTRYVETQLREDDAQAILALLDEWDALAQGGDFMEQRVTFLSDRVTALEEGLRAFQRLRIRFTGRGSLPLDADKFAAATKQARALLAAAPEIAKEPDDR